MRGPGRYFFFRLRFGGQIGCDLFLGATGLDAPGEGFGIPVGLRVGVLFFDEKPLVTFTPSLHQNYGEGSVELFAVQAKLQVAASDLRQTILFANDLEDAAIPQHHAACAVVAFGDVAFEIAVVKGVVFHHGGEGFLSRVESWTLGYGPRFQRAADLQPEVVMQVRRVVALDEEAAGMRGRRLGCRGFRLRSSAEIAFLRVFFERHKRLEMFSFHVIANMRVYGQYLERASYFRSCFFPRAPVYGGTERDDQL